MEMRVATRNLPAGLQYWNMRSWALKDWPPMVIAKELEVRLGDIARARKLDDLDHELAEFNELRTELKKRYEEHVKRDASGKLVFEDSVAKSIRLYVK